MPTENKNDFLALALAKLGVDTIDPYTSEDTAIKMATVRSSAENQPYGVYHREGAQWYCMGVAVDGVYTPKPEPEEVDGTGR